MNKKQNSLMALCSLVLLLQVGVMAPPYNVTPVANPSADLQAQYSSAVQQLMLNDRSLNQMQTQLRDAPGTYTGGSDALESARTAISRALALSVEQRREDIRSGEHPVYSAVYQSLWSLTRTLTLYIPAAGPGGIFNAHDENMKTFRHTTGNVSDQERRTVTFTPLTPTIAPLAVTKSLGDMVTNTANTLQAFQQSAQGLAKALLEGSQVNAAMLSHVGGYRTLGTKYAKLPISDKTAANEVLEAALTFYKGESADANSGNTLRDYVLGMKAIEDALVQTLKDVNAQNPADDEGRKAKKEDQENAKEALGQFQALKKSTKDMLAQLKGLFTATPKTSGSKEVKVEFKLPTDGQQGDELQKINNKNAYIKDLLGLDTIQFKPVERKCENLFCNTDSITSLLTLFVGPAANSILPKTWAALNNPATQPSVTLDTISKEMVSVLLSSSTQNPIFAGTFSGKLHEAQVKYDDALKAEAETAAQTPAKAPKDAAAETEPAQKSWPAFALELTGPTSFFALLAYAAYYVYNGAVFVA